MTNKLECLLMKICFSRGYYYGLDHIITLEGKAPVLSTRVI